MNKLKLSTLNTNLFISLSTTILDNISSSPTDRFCTALFELTFFNELNYYFPKIKIEVIFYVIFIKKF